MKQLQFVDPFWVQTKRPKDKFWKTVSRRDSMEAARYAISLWKSFPESLDFEYRVVNRVTFDITLL